MTEKTQARKKKQIGDCSDSMINPQRGTSSFCMWESEKTEVACSRGFLMTRFMVPILMCPANYDIAMLAFSKLFHVMREREMERQRKREGMGTAHYVGVSFQSVAQQGVVMN